MYNKKGEKMSYYYQYYIGYMENGKIYPYGPYTSERKLKPIVEKSRSFASDLHEYFVNVAEVQISEELRNEFGYKDWQGIESVSVKYLLYENLPNGDYIVKGYFPIDDVQAWEQGDDDSLFYNVINPIVYAAMAKNEIIFGKNQPKKDAEGNEYTKPNASEYMYYAAPQYNSKEYEAFQIRAVINMLYDYDFFADDTKKIVILETEG